MNILGIQIFGVIIGLIMMFLSYYSLKKKEFHILDFILWFSVWLFFSLAVIFPMSLKIFLQTFGVISVVQLFSIVGMMFIFIVVFSLYKAVRKNTKQVEQIVKDLALKKLK